MKVFKPTISITDKLAWIFILNQKNSMARSQDKGTFYISGVRRSAVSEILVKAMPKPKYEKFRKS